MKALQKIKNSITIGPRNPSPGYLLEKLGNMYSPRYMHPYVHCSTIHGGQDVKTTKVTFERGLDKEDVVHVYNGILLNHKKRRNTVICNNMDGP